MSHSSKCQLTELVTWHRIQDLTNKCQMPELANFKTRFLCPELQFELIYWSMFSYLVPRFDRNPKCILQKTCVGDDKNRCFEFLRVLVNFVLQFSIESYIYLEDVYRRDDTLVWEKEKDWHKFSKTINETIHLMEEWKSCCVKN